MHRLDPSHQRRPQQDEHGDNQHHGRQDGTSGHFHGRHDGRIGHDGRRRHGGEMHAADRHGQGQRRQNAAAQVGLAPDGQQGKRPEHHADRQRSDHIAPVPEHHALGPERPHADEMHGADAAAHQGAAGGLECAVRRCRGEGEPRGGEHHGRRQGPGGAQKVVAGAQMRNIGQHGDEVGGPHPRAEADARHGQGAPSQGHLALRRTGMQPDGRAGRQKANERGHQDKPDVVAISDAVQHPEHGASSGSFCSISI